MLKISKKLIIIHLFKCKFLFVVVILFIFYYYFFEHCLIGAWSDEVAKLAGLSLPLTVLKHAYVVSESMPGVVGLPNIRDMDSSIYIRINGDSIFVGGFEKNPVILDKVFLIIYFLLNF